MRSSGALAGTQAVFAASNNKAPEGASVTRRVVPAGITVALLLTGCGSTSTSVQSDGSDAPGVTDAATVNCGGSVYDPTELADAPPASSLPDGPAGAVDDAGAPAFDASPDWKVVYQSDDRVDLVRELDEPSTTEAVTSESTSHAPSSGSPALPTCPMAPGC